MLKKLIAIILSSIIAFSVFAVAGSASLCIKPEVNKELKFNDNGKFTILNLSDIQDGFPLTGITKDLIKDTIDATNPDLIVLTGDNIAGYSCPNKLCAMAAINEYMSIFEKRGIPVAQVFGNHDDQDTTATKDFQMDCYEMYDCFVGKRNPEKMAGQGTYNLPILSSDKSHYAFNLWLTDSGTNNDENDLGGYGCVHKDQIAWYVKESNKLKEENGGVCVPSINFQHIIVPEIYKVLDKQADNSYKLPAGSIGELNEKPCPPYYSNGQFDAFLKQGDVIATVSGHDHTNTFVVNYKGIDIINTPGVGFDSYDGLVVGSRVIVLDENDPENYETYCLSYFDIYDKADTAAQLRFNIYSDTTDTATKIISLFKYIPVKIASLFRS